MCLQDLNLGRGRYLGTVTTVTGANNNVLKPNPQRVAVMFIGNVVTYFDAGGAGLTQDTVIITPADTTINAKAFTLCMGGSILKLNVEEFGQLVTGPWTVQVNNQTGAANCSVIEILSQIEGKPAFTDRDLQ